MMLKKILISAGVIYAVCASSAMAQKSGDVVVSLGGSYITPQVSTGNPSVSGTPVYSAQVQSYLNGAQASVGSAAAPTVSAMYMFTDHIGGELQIGYPPKLNMSFVTNNGGSDSGAITAKMLSPVIAAKYYFGEAKSTFRPYLSAGVTYISFSETAVNHGSSLYNYGLANTSASLSSAWAPQLGAGLAYNINDSWIAQAGLTYTQLKTTLTMSGSNPQYPAYATTATSDLKINAMEYSIKLGYKF